MAKLKRGILGKFVNVFVERVHSLGQVAEQQSEVRIPNFLIFPDINTLNFERISSASHDSRERFKLSGTLQ